ncbi:MAG TPA: TrmH family RNA methyltransferase [Patescibacteria group bacterium]|nr:TrmH family RNA methyltransferase [Patescibacteria group bacterium]
MQKLKPGVLRHQTPSEEDLKTIRHNPIYIVSDNVIDTYNIGSLFRLSDAVSAKRLFICGESEYPPSSRIHKAAVGTENWVPWSKIDDIMEVINKLKSEGVQIIAVEQDKRSIPIKELSSKVKFPCAIVVGNETGGVKKEVLETADIIVELPMYGINHSFNVWGAAAVVAYKITELLES